VPGGNGSERCTTLRVGGTTRGWSEGELTSDTSGIQPSGIQPKTDLAGCSPMGSNPAGSEKAGSKPFLPTTMWYHALSATLLTYATDAHARAHAHTRAMHMQCIWTCRFAASMFSSRTPSHIPSHTPQCMLCIWFAASELRFQLCHAAVFDDSFEHEVRNDCERERVVFQVVLRHPDLWDTGHDEL
jgi:hypothetical protein